MSAPESWLYWPLNSRRLTADEWVAIKDYWRQQDCPAHGPLTDDGGCAGCVAEDRATDAWEGA